ncbi:MAG: DUF2651 family protein [Clostridia bacterium]|nr:DUF2651 family protein [Clostridia bacterium]
MNTLLIFFAFPIAVIIISVILQKILNSPIAVAALIFAIFLIVTFAVFDETFLIATLVYTIISFITALIVRFICHSNNDNNICELLNCVLRNNNMNDLLNNISNNSDNNNQATLNTVANILSSNNNNSNKNNNSCGCNRYRRFR